MRANRPKDTGPERLVRSRLHAAGLRYRVHFTVRVDDGRPISIDVAFPAIKLAIFIDGCFWHGCPQHKTVPASNVAYWGPKLARNAERDKTTTARLEMAGWQVRRYWEHVDAGEVATGVASLVAMLRDHKTGQVITQSKP